MPAQATRTDTIMLNLPCCQLPGPTRMLAGAGSSAIKRLERKFRRLRLNDFQLDLRGALTLGMPYAASRPPSKPGRPLVLLQQVYRIEAGPSGKFRRAGNFCGTPYCRKGTGSCARATAAM